MPDQTAPQEDKVPLLDALADLGNTLTQSDIPSPSRLLHTVGAIVKVLDNAGVEVADELFPAEEEPVSRPETAQAQHQVKTESRLERLEDALERVLGHLERPAAETPSAETPPDAGTQGNPPSSASPEAGS
jgi:hypothetical protein